MASSGRISGISATSQTQAVVARTLMLAPASERRRLVQLFRAAAEANGNRHLTQNEAELVADAYALRGLEGVEKKVQAAILKAREQRDPDGIETYFTSTTSRMDEVIVGHMDGVVKAAGGLPVDLNIMIFSFTDAHIGDEILRIAKKNPNVTFRLIADFSQLTTSGGRQPPRLESEAKKRKLGNVRVKFKKDGAFRWNDKLKRPVYHHGSSHGLNHHKGFVASIDGHPRLLATGSYNWSDTAEQENYENLVVFSADHPANLDAIAAYQAEFVAFYNHPDTLSPDEARAHKRKIWSDLRAKHGGTRSAAGRAPHPLPPYEPNAPGPSFDLNHLTDANYTALEAMAGRRLAGSIAYALATYGPYADFEELEERVPAVADLPTATRKLWAHSLYFGLGHVLINTATESELTRNLKFTKKAAQALLRARKKAGDFESVDEVAEVPGITRSVFARISYRLSDDLSRAFFSSRGYDDPEAGTGYADVNAERKVPVLGEGGEVVEEAARLSAAVIDLLRRAKKGELARIAMYGMSTGTAEYDAIVAAAKRGVELQIVLNDDYNAGTITALKTLAKAGLPIDVRMQRARTMHEKFGIVGDDIFQGSANFSGSSSEKHSEDRFVVKNNPELARAFHAEMDLLWERSR